MQMDQVEIGRVAAAHPREGLTVEVRGLVKRFGERNVLHGLDLDIEAGQFVTIVGRSGCGKSTLLRQLAGLDTLSEGAIRLDGEDRSALGGEVRMMFQDSRLLPWRTVIQNVTLGLSGKRAELQAKAEQALAEVGLADRAALTRIEMQRLIERVWRQHGFTAVLVTHDVAEAVALADRILLVEDGRITLDEAVTLPRPREHGEAPFAAIERRVLKRLMTVEALNQRNQLRGRVCEILVEPVR